MSVATAPIDSPFLHRAALASLRHLCFAPRPRTIVDGTIAGRHRSHRQGGSAEFTDYRAYAPGDDLRRLDWKVLARSGRPFVRQYEDESSLRVTLMIDGSTSMDFNGGEGLTKLRYAQFVVTSLAELILRQQDQAGIAVAADDLGTHVRPARGAAHAFRVHAAVADIAPMKSSQLDRAIRQLRQADPTRGMLLLASDFLVDDLEKLFAEIRTLRADRWHVLLLHIVHPLEQHLPTGPAWRFEGLEAEGQLDCSPASVAMDYERQFSAYAESIRARAIACGCDHRRVSTATPWLDVVRSYLVSRGG